MKNILITGGAGFIGSEIIRQLHKKHKYNITVLDSLTEQIHGKQPKHSYLFQLVRDKCALIRADVRDFNVVSSAVADCDCIIHLAAETGTGQSMYQINLYNEVNVIGLSNIFQALSFQHDKKPEKIILASSRSVYGEGKYFCPNHGEIFPQSRNIDNMLTGDFNMYCNCCGKRVHPIPTTEDSKIQPSSLYALTKCMQEQLIKVMCPPMDIQYTILRLQNVYGEGQSLKNPYTGILSIFSTLLLENKEVNVFEDGTESRDFVHVTDVARAVVDSIDCIETNSEIINIGSGTATSVIDIATMLKDIYQSASDIKITGDFRMGDIAYNVASIQKAQKLLRFSPTVELREGLRRFCIWAMDQEFDTSNYYRSLQEMECFGMLTRKDIC